MRYEHHAEILFIQLFSWKLVLITPSSVFCSALRGISQCMASMYQQNKNIMTRRNKVYGIFFARNFTQVIRKTLMSPKPNLRRQLQKYFRFTFVLCDSSRRLSKPLWMRKPERFPKKCPSYLVHRSVPGEPNASLSFSSRKMKPKDSNSWRS